MVYRYLIRNLFKYCHFVILIFFRTFFYQALDSLPILPNGHICRKRRSAEDLPRAGLALGSGLTLAACHGQLRRGE